MTRKTRARITPQFRPGLTATGCGALVRRTRIAIRRPFFAVVTVTMAATIAACSRGSGTVQAPNASAETYPARELAELDQRHPVPLQPMMANHQKQNMRAHLEAVQRITQGLASEDWDAIQKAAQELGTSPQMQHMCKMMGSGAPGFTAMGLNFHERADGIAAAAEKHDAKGVLKAMSNTLSACTACHTTYRQDVVSESVWQLRTKVHEK